MEIEKQGSFFVDLPNTFFQACEAANRPKMDFVVKISTFQKKFEIYSKSVGWSKTIAWGLRGAWGPLWTN